MKLLPVLLASTVVANVVLIGAFVTRPSLAPPSVRDFFSRRGSSDQTEKSGTATAPRPKAAMKEATQSQLWTALHSMDLKTLVDKLRAAGFPPSVVRAIVDAEIEARFAPRIQAIKQSVESVPFWRSAPGSLYGNSKMYAELSQVYRERSRALRDLLGKDAFAWGGGDPDAAQRRMYGNLSQAKIDMVQRINDDYAEMTGEVRAAMQGVTLPEDRQKLALLEKEKRADLAAVLTPEELADYEFRSSMTTSRLRTPLAIMDATDAEFRAIFQILHPLQDQINPTVGGVFTGDMMSQRREVTKKANEQIKAVIGETRFADYERATDREYQQLHRLGQQSNLAPEVVTRAFDLRDSTNAAANKIYDQPGISRDEKLLAMKNLAQTTKNQLLSTLGPTAGPAYVDNARWLAGLEHGSIVTSTGDGMMTTSRSLNNPRMGPPGAPPGTTKSTTTTTTTTISKP
jgi:hypothetical protein